MRTMLAKQSVNPEPGCFGYAPWDQGLAAPGP
jgi:hypothetical protein